MGMETRVCACGAEYEQSEWSVDLTAECEACRNPPSPFEAARQNFANINLDQMYRQYRPYLSGGQWVYGPGTEVRVDPTTGTTYTVTYTQG